MMMVNDNAEPQIRLANSGFTAKESEEFIKEIENENYD